MRRLRSLLVTTAIALLILLTGSGVSARSENAGPYTYADESYSVLLDSNKTEYKLVGFGCGFERQGDEFTNAVKRAYSFQEAGGTGEPPVKETEYCPSSGSPKQANAYWATTDFLSFLVVSGDRASSQRPPIPADSGLSGNGVVSHVLFDNDGIGSVFSTASINTSTANAGMTSGNNPDFENNCRQEAGVLSWLVCPAINLVNKFVAKLTSLVLELLEVEPLLLGDARDKGLQSAWKQFLTIANLLLIPVIIFSIYALLVSGGSKYAVTRILPRLAVAIILMQFSYYIAAFIIDLGNVIAAGISGIFNYVNEGIKADLGENLQLSEALGGNALNRGVGAVAGTGLLIAVSWLFIAPALPPAAIIGLVFLVGIIITFLVLALRELAITVFVVISPLALLLGVLPSTEKWMREWFDNIIKLVMIYPMIVLFFSVSSTLSLLSLGTGQSEINQIVSALLPVVALVTIPLTFRMAGTLFGRFSVALTGLGRRMESGIEGDIRDPGSMRFQKRLDKMAGRVTNVRRANATPGLMWTSRFTKGARLERTMYNLGGDSISGVISAKFPDKLKRVFWGDRAFRGMLGVEGYSEDVIRNTDWFKYDAHKIRNNIGEFTTLAMSELPAYASGHFDRQTDTLFAFGQQVKDGTLRRDIAAEGFGAFQNVHKSAHRYVGTPKFEDTLDPFVREPKDLYHLVYGDYTTLPSHLQEVNLQRKKSHIAIASGTLTESQDEGTFRSVADSLRDDRIWQTAQQQTDEGRDLRQSIAKLIRKADSMKGSLRSVGLTEQLARGMADNNEDISAGGFYGKPGNEIKAMLDFIDAAERARQATGISVQSFGPSDDDWEMP